VLSWSYFSCVSLDDGPLTLRVVYVTMTLCVLDSASGDIRSNITLRLREIPDSILDLDFTYPDKQTKTNELRGLSLQANYTDQATADCRLTYCQRYGSPTAVF
jgi:hypothetical protein